MPLPRPDPSALPANVLFPEEYKESARMIVRDFAFFGAALVVALVGSAVFAQGLGI